MISRILNKFSIKQITVFSLIVFSISLLVLTTFSLINTNSKIQQSNLDAKLIILLDAIEKVAHTHAVERGLTAGFLGSDESTIPKKLGDARRQADRTMEQIDQIFQSEWPEHLQLKNHLQLLRQHAQAKSNIRRLVDTKNSQGVFTYYSTLNKLALESMQNIRLYIHNRKLLSTINGAINLAWFKEYAGQARGKINGSLASQQITVLSRSDVSSYISGMQTTSDYLKLILEGQALTAFNQLLGLPDSQMIKNVYQQILTPNVRIASIPMTSEQWFPIATKQIVNIKKLIDEKLMDSHTQSEEAKAREKNLLILKIIVILSIFAILVVLNSHLILSLMIRLEILTSRLRKVAEQGDLTVNIGLKGNDELSTISNAVSTTLMTFKEVIVGLAASIKSGTNISNKLKEASQDALAGAETTHLMASNIATSLDQMSQSSIEISTSAASTFNASEELNQRMQATIEVNNANINAMDSMTTNMSQARTKANRMEEKVGAISGILENINSLAEQTNLLALNAAIEAARAGEAGRGFAVVAGEVRNLAVGSKESSELISTLLVELQTASNEVIDSIETNVSSSKQVVERGVNVKELSLQLVQGVKEVEQLSTVVASASEQQSTTIKHIAQDIAEVLSASDLGLKTAKELAIILTDLESNSQELQSKMKHFTIVQKN